MCNLCNKKYKSTISLARHKREKHMSIRHEEKTVEEALFLDQIPDLNDSVEEDSPQMDKFVNDNFSDDDMFA